MLTAPIWQITLRMRDFVTKNSYTPPFTVITRHDCIVVHILQAIEQPFLMAVREVLGHKYTAYLDRLYRRVIHFILGMLIVGYKQTYNASARAAQHYDDSNN